MAIKQIKISNATKDILDILKDKYSYSTYENCVNSVVTFVFDNGIDPTDVNIGNFKNSLLDIEMRISKNISNAQKQLNADNVSLRKWVGAIERDYLVPISKNIEVVDKFVNYNIANKTNEKIEKLKFDNPVNSNLVPVKVDENTSTEKQNIYKELLVEREKSEELLVKNQKQISALQQIFSNSKIEEGGMLSKGKITIEMSIEEWKKLSNINY